MSEADMVDAMNQALVTLGVADAVEAAGQFQPRGTSGAFVTGGLVGATAGDALGGVLGDALGEVGGAWAGAAAAAAGQGLPEYLLVGVSPTMVYGMPGRSRHRAPTSLVFAVARQGLRSVVHQRGAVRVLELLHDDTGSQIELEGSRIPVTHSKDVIDLLTGR
jgi:hypothetical protein